MHLFRFLRFSLNSVSMIFAQLCMMLLFSISSNSFAQIRLDTQFSQTPLNLSTNLQITPAHGQQQGTNLFHSFSEFSIPEGYNVIFTNDANNSINRIISRVTGNQSSTFAGTLNSPSSADFYFFNPNGIVFKQSAQLNIAGNSWFSTASRLIFEDGQLFSVDATANFALLTTAAPQAFGFLNTAEIQLQSSNLQLTAHQNFSLSASNLKLLNSSISVPDGYLHLAAVGDVSLQNAVNLPLLSTALATVETPNRFLNGTISIEQQIGVARPQFNNRILGNLDSSGNEGGQIFIQSGQLLLSQASINSLTNATQRNEKQAEIRIEARQVHLDKASVLNSSTIGLSDGGDIHITALESISLDNYSRIASDAGSNRQSALGNGGNIHLQTPKLTLATASSIQTGAGILGALSGNGGNININAQNVDLSGQSHIIALSVSANGHGGDIHFSSDDIFLRDGSTINVSSVGRGNAGIVAIQAQHLWLSNQSAIFALALNARGGDIQLNIEDGLYSFDSVLSTEARGLQVANNGGNLTINHPNFAVLSNSRLLANAVGGNGGNIHLNADYLFELEANIFNASSEQGIEGEVTLSAPIMDLSNQLNPLTLRYLSATTWLTKRCSARLGGEISSFIVNYVRVLEMPACQLY